MANTTSGLFETLVAAFVEASAAPQFENVMLDCIYKQYRGISARYGQTLQVNIPTVVQGNVEDIGGGPIQVKDRTQNTVNITINHNLSNSFVIYDWDQVRTPQDLHQLYVGAAHEELLRAANATVTALINSTSFGNYTTVTGGDNIFTRANLATMWQNLRGAGCPDQLQNQFFITHQVPFSGSFADATQNFLQQYIVGEAAATNLQQRVVWAPQFNCQVRYDQLVPTTSTTYSGLMFHRYAIAMVPVRVPLGTDSNAANSVKEGYVMLKPEIPARVQMWYDPVQQGHVVHVHTVFGLAVTRPEFGSYFVTT